MEQTLARWVLPLSMSCFLRIFLHMEQLFLQKDTNIYFGSIYNNQRDSFFGVSDRIELV